ncbi:MAG: GTPase ObgE [Planctomycetota bacterium]|nr:GTPase ObgE [Planctomycetota bacterium]
MLIDSATILVKSGRGGDGHVSFARYKYIPKGGPSGGDGGDGADVILRAVPNLDTLLDFAGKHHWDAPHGDPGGKKQKHGGNGEHLIIQVPPGTLVYDDTNGELIADLDAPGKEILVAKGGRGGFGNEHYATSTNQAPRVSTPGEPSVERRLRLELKLMADLGLLGKPNAGKSTLLSRVSRARPKIADYPFTTLEPNLGIAELTSSSVRDASRRLVMADIPGLIEGAHTGAGLGIQFLRHIERTRLLVHLIEVQPADGSDPLENFRVINAELAAYSVELAAKPQIIALTKIDLIPDEDERREAIEHITRELGRPVFPISSATGAGVRELLEACWRALHPA